MPTRYATPKKWLAILVCLVIGIPCALYAAWKLAGADKIVTGRVLDDGQPVAGATVYIQTFRFRGAEVKLQRAVSHADGSFKFQVANWHDECEIYAWLPGKQVGEFTLTPDDELYGGSLQDIPPIVRLRPVGQLKVRVVDEKGKPVAGVRVGPTGIGVGQNHIQPVPAVFRELGAVTGADGRANIDSLPFVSYSTLGVDDSKFALTNKLAETPKAFEVKLVVQPACHLSGRVTLDGIPVGGLVLFWHARDPFVYGWVATDSQGTFQIARAPKGKVTIASATTGKVEDDYLLPKTQGPADPGVVGRFDIKLNKGTLVRFKVHDPSGKLAVHARVSGELSNPPTGPGNIATAEVLGSWRAPVTDQDGTTRVRLKPERYMVITSRSGNFFGSTQNMVVGNGPIQDVTLQTPPAEALGALRVKVIDAEGNPVRTLVWYSYEDVNRHTKGKADYWTGQDGVTIPGKDVPNRRMLQMRAQCGNEFSDLIVPRKNGLVVLKLHHVNLGSVQGVVTDTAGHPVEGAQLQLDPNSTVPAATNTDICPNTYKTGPDGHFTFNGLYPGLETFFTVHTPGYADAQTQSFTVVANKTIRLPTVVQKTH